MLLRTLFCGAFARVLWPVLAGVLALVILIHAEGWSLRSPVQTSNEPAPTGRSPRPDEFLYLDTERTLAYLAQLQGGTTTGEAISEKLTNTIGGKLALAGLEANGNRAEEDLTERQVSPTGASSYIALLGALRSAGELDELNLRCAKCLKKLNEGQFVLFKTDSMRPPLYANPYFAVRQDATLSAIFPTADANPTKRRLVLAEREAARRFVKQVGDDPRIVFDLRPGKSPRSVQYLLPVSYQQLTSERSLIKYGGGEFTVLGKLVRILPEPSRPLRPSNTRKGEAEEAYVDSATREIWGRPLAGALFHLLCRSDPACLERVHAGGKAKRDALKHTRGTIEKVLSNQTQIKRRGAVILPIAIYK
jgi:hypothetical protein